MAYSLAPVIKQQFFDDNGNPLAGGKVYAYQAGTTTPQATYTSSTGGVANPNPVILDAGGRAAIWLDTNLSYKFLVKTSADVAVENEDNIIGLSTNNSVATASIQDGAVTTAKLAADSVDSTILKDDASIDANRAVTTNHVRDANITRAKLATGAVGKQTVTSTKTTTYVATAADDVVPCDATSGAFTVTLPTAAGITGQVFTFLKTDSSVNQVTIDGNGTETINGSLTRKLSTQNESMRIVSDGSNWLIIHRQIPSEWTTYSLTIGASTTPPTPGTNTNLAKWRRVGDSMEIVYYYAQTAGGSGGSGVYLFPLPTGYTIDTAKASVTTANANLAGAHVLGPAFVANIGTGGSATCGPGAVVGYNTTNLSVYGPNASQALNQISGTSFSLGATSVVNINFHAMVPITGWEG